MFALREVRLVTPESETGPGPDETNGITNESDDCGPVDGPQVLNHIVLARKKGESQTICGTSETWSLTQIFHKLLVPRSPKTPDGLSRLVGHDVTALTRRFLFDQVYPDNEIPGSDVSLDLCPRLSGPISVFHSAVATYYAPSDASGIGGMYRERIRATPAWNRGESSIPRYDCVLVQVSPEDNGFCSMQAARVRLFFSIKHNDKTIPCALIEWYETVETPQIRWLGCGSSNRNTQQTAGASLPLFTWIPWCEVHT